MAIEAEDAAPLADTPGVVTGLIEVLLLGMERSHDRPNTASGGQIGFAVRRTLRIPVEWACEYWRDDGPASQGTIIDLSPGGCAIRKTAHVQRGDALRLLIFTSPNQSPIEIDLALVRWSTLVQFGVEFMALSPFNTQRLQQYLECMQSDYLEED